nr:hypothetical protein [Coprococcus sp. AF21-14LB]
MFQNIQQVQDFIQEKGIRFVDFKMIDLGDAGNICQFRQSVSRKKFWSTESDLTVQITDMLW